MSTEVASSKSAIAPEILEKVKAANPGIETYTAEFSTGAVILRAPSLPEYRRFNSMQTTTSGKNMENVETLIRSCILYPDQDGLTAMFNRQPALIFKIGDTAVDLAGASEAVQVKKL